MQALGPYALFARQQAPAYWADPAAQPVAPCTFSIPQPAAAMYGFSEETILPPHFQALAARPARAGGSRPGPSAAPSTNPALSPAPALTPAAAAAEQACRDASPAGPVPMETEGPGSSATEPALAVGRRRIMRGSATRSRWTKCAIPHLSHACHCGAVAWWPLVMRMSAKKGCRGFSTAVAHPCLGCACALSGVPQHKPVNSNQQNTTWFRDNSIRSHQASAGKQAAPSAQNASIRACFAG